jgi:hypothetical protein
MMHVISVYRMARVAFFALAGWLTLQAVVWAQPPGAKKEEPQGGSYVMSYGLVILCIALGMLFVCRSSHRRERARPENYDEAKVM